MTLSEIVKLKETANGSPKAIAKPKEPLPTLPESDNVSFNLSDEEISLRKKDMNRLMKAELGQGQAIQKEERSQGWIGNLFDDAKTMLGCDTSKKSLDDSYVNSETGKKINDLQNQVGKLSDEDFAKKYKEITGTELTNDRAKNTKPPENKPSETKPSSTESKPPEKPKEETPPMKLASNKALDKKLKDYKESQEEGVELITDAGVTVAAVAAATIAVAAAPVVLTAAGVTAAGAALGTGTALAVGAGTGAVVGAGTKVGLKYSDAETGGREYTSLKNDLVKGGLNGALSGLMPGGTTAIEKTLVEKGISKGTAEFVGARATDLSFGSLYNPASNLIDGKTTTVGGVLKDAAVGGATMTLFGSALGGITKGAGKVFSKGFSLVRGGTETAGKEALESTVGKTASTTETAVNSSTSKPTSAAEATVSNPIKKSTEPIEEAATTKLEVTQEPKGIPVTTDSSIELLPGFSKKEPLNAKEINPESLVLVHLTDYPPQNGQILSAREATGASRISNHFTLNDPVGEHHFGSWDASPCAILAPYKETVALNETGLFIEGLPNDLYTRGSVKIPEGSVIIKHNPEIEKGKYKISDYEGLSGCKLIETSENVHSTASNVIEQMGYTRCSHKTELGVFSQGIGDKGDIANTAREMALGRTNLFAKIKGITGLTPNDFMLNIKLKVAAEYLINISEMNIADITYELGYSSPRYFNKCFKELFGLAPNIYRQQNRSNSKPDYEKLIDE